MNQPAVSLESVSRRFGRVDALDSVTLDIERDAITGLLGRNGAGKTTLMSIIAGHDRASSGTVRVLGRDPFEDAGIMSSTSLVRDNQRYPEDFRLRHVLEIGPVFHPNWDAELASELAADFRLPARTPIKKYSRGQLSSIGIVIGLASRAAISIFDEPYLGLDATARRYFYDVLMRDYLEYPRTIILSTHLIDEMEPLLEHVVILEAGRLVRAATAEDLRGSATTVSGLANVVDELVQGRTVLQTRRVGALSSVLVDGPADDALRAAAARSGAQIESAGLQDLVAAYGGDDSTILEGARS